MEMKQVFDLVNQTTKEVLGEETVLKDDLTNVVDIGEEIFNANKFDHYVKTLVDHIGKVVFVNRPYDGGVPKVLMDGWEFGAVLEKVSIEMPQATENESWELEDGAIYETNQFYKPKVSVKFYSKRTTFEVPMSITEKQVKSAFSSAVQLNAFVSAIYTAIYNSLTVKLESLIKDTINNGIAETIYAEYPSGGYTTKSTVKAVNLLKLFNDASGKKLTKDKCLFDLDFLKFASYQMMLIIGRMKRMSTLFNIGGKERHTPLDLMHVILLDEFDKASSVFLQADTYHKELVSLKNYDTVPYWQGSGKTYSFADTSKINVKTGSAHDVEIDGILAVAFDRDALGVANMDKRVKTHYVEKAEFTNSWFKEDAGYFNDLNENLVVFFVA